MNKPTLFTGRTGRTALAAAITAVLSVFRADAADIVKANNTNALNLTTSWVGGVVPANTDVAVWDNTVPAANSSALGGSASWLGIRIANPGGAVTVTHAAGNALTLGDSGIDLSAATQNLTLLNTANTAGTIGIGANQTWNVATARTLTLFASSNTQNQALTGSGNIQITTAGTGLINLNVGDSTSTGFSAGGNSGFSGNWTIGTGATGSGRVNTLRNGINAWGTGTITLNGGTIAQAQGNWNWANNILLQTGTTSTIDDANTSGNRTLKLYGTISGDGNLVFAETGGGAHVVDGGFILAGANTLSGTVTINSGAVLRVGGDGGANNSTLVGSTGTLGTAAVVNNGTLTLSRDNTWTFANAVSGTGLLRIGLNTGSATHVVTVSGNNSHTGGTTLQSAVTLKLGNASALGTGVFTIAGNGFFDNATGAAIAVPNALTLSGGSPTFNGSNDMSFGGAVTLAGANRTLTVNASTLTLNGGITGAFNLTKAGGGTLVFGGTNTHSATTVNAGALVLDYGTNDTSKLADAAALTLGSVRLTLAGASGAHPEIVGSTVLNGAAILTRTGANTAEISLGAITRSASGFLNVATANLANTTTANVNGILPGVTLGSADLAANDGADNIVAFTGYSDVTRLESGAKTIADGATQQIRVTDGAGSSPAAITPAAAGTTTINSLVNSATGGAATVDLGAGNTLRLGSVGVVLAGAGTGGLSVENGTLTAGGADNTAGDILAGNSGATLTISSAIANNGTGAVTFTKMGGGTVILSGTNTHTGLTTVREGTLELSGGAAIANTGAVTLANAAGALLKISASETIGNLTGGGALGGNVDLGANTLTVTSSAGVQVLGGAVSGTGTLVKAGTGTLTLEGVNSFSGLYDLTTGGGLAFRSLGADDGKPSVNVGAGTEFALGADFAGQTATISALSGAGTISAQFDTPTGTKTLEVEQAANTAFSGVIRDNTDSSQRLLALKKSGSGTLSLSGVNLFTGGVTISGGTLEVNADSALGASGRPVAISNNAELQASGAVTTATRTITLGTGGGIIDTNGNTVNLDTGSTVTGTSLTKTGDGTLRLAGTQTYATLTASAGTTNVKSALGTGTSTINANAIVNIGTSQTLAALNIGAGGVVTLDSALPSPAPAFAEADLFGAEASAAVVPEPGALGLLLAGAAALLRRPRRTCLQK